MAVYKGKYIKQSDDTYTVELYTDDTVSETINNVPRVDEATRKDAKIEVPSPYLTKVEGFPRRMRSLSIHGKSSRIRLEACTASIEATGRQSENPPNVSIKCLTI